MLLPFGVRHEAPVHFQLNIATNKHGEASFCKQIEHHPDDRSYSDTMRRDLFFVRSGSIRPDNFIVENAMQLRPDRCFPRSNVC